MINYNDIITKAETCQWIPASTQIPKDGQFILVLYAGGICTAQQFYLYDYLCNDSEGRYGPAGHWGSGAWEALYWYPIPSVVGLTGFEPANYMRVLEDRAAKMEAVND